MPNHSSPVCARRQAASRAPWRSAEASVATMKAVLDTVFASAGGLLVVVGERADLLIAVLELVEFVVEAALGQQALMRALFP